MSQQNVELVHRLYRAMDARDVKAIEELADPDMEWISDPRVGGGPVRGRDEVLKFFLERAEMFGEISTEVERVLEADDKVLAFIRVSGQGAASGAGFEIRIAHLWTFRNGLIVRGQGYGDREQALEAAGLSD